jgi:hypothetical protein
MGHSNILISQRYVHPTPERVEMAFADLDAYNQECVQAAIIQAEKAAAKTLAQTACPPIPPTIAKMAQFLDRAKCYIIPLFSNGSRRADLNR